MTTLATGISSDELVHNIDVMIAQGHIRTFILLYSEKDDPVVERLKQFDVQYVVIGKPYQEVNKTSYVDNDNIQAGTDAAQYLIDHGHRRIGFLYSDLSRMVQSDRMLGYQRVMMQNHLPNIMLEERFETHAAGVKTLHKFFEQYPDVTGFVAVDDMLALKLQQVLHNDPDWKVKQFSLIGFNNSIFSDLAHPMLTSIAVFPQRLGEEAAKIAMADHPADELSTAVIVPHQIVKRHSVHQIKSLQ